MAKSEKQKLPPARIAHTQGGRFAPLVALLRPFQRLRFGRSEFTAVAIVSGIVLATGLMLAGFGAANKHGLGEQYTASVADSPSDQTLRSKCSLVATGGESCRDTWERAMARGEGTMWNGVDDWQESECGYTHTYVCYERVAPAPGSYSPAQGEQKRRLSPVEATK